ncbi:MAG: CotH kinase family protein [Crocinitomicaceae bacterium]|nr:CotH kinase family protein [Crocinitomicaceae bacterium]
MRGALFLFAFISCATFSQKDSLIFSHKPGIYEGNFALKVKSIKNHPIRYTTDGTVPDFNSEVLSDSLPVTTLIYSPNKYDNIQTGIRPRFGATIPFKGHTLRFASFENQNMISEVYTKSYFVNFGQDYRIENVSILSLIIDEKKLFNDTTGIYVSGKSDDHNFNQRGKSSEREALVQLINENNYAEFSDSVRIRIHGGKSRELFQKSLRIKKEGKNIVGSWLGIDSLSGETVILRNSMSCWSKTLFKDDLSSYLCRNLNFTYSPSRLVIVFINGEYWGIQSIRPYLDNDYFANIFNCSAEVISVIDFKEQELQSIPELYNRLSLIHSLPMNKLKNYAFAMELFDEANIIDFFCAEIFFNNLDWPRNNTKIVYSYNDQKVRFLFHDLDAGWTKYEDKTIFKLKADKTLHDLNAGRLFKSLSDNDSFKLKIISRMNFLLEHDFHPDTLIKGINVFETKYEKHVDYHTRKWTVPGSLNQWKGKIEQLRNFANSRHEVIREELLTFSK